MTVRVSRRRAALRRTIPVDPFPAFGAFADTLLLAV
jgi:hypothetical protein